MDDMTGHAALLIYAANVQASDNDRKLKEKAAMSFPAAEIWVEQWTEQAKVQAADEAKQEADHRLKVDAAERETELLEKTAQEEAEQRETQRLEAEKAERLDYIEQQRKDLEAQGNLQKPPSGLPPQRSTDGAPTRVTGLEGAPTITPHSQGGD